MKILLLAATAAAALATTAAYAQDADTNYSGFYIGAYAGASKAANHGGETIMTDRNLNGDFGETADALPNFTFSGGQAVGDRTTGRIEKDSGTPIAGARVGWDYQAGNWVVGALAEIEQNNVSDTVSGFTSNTTPATYVFHRDLDTLAAVRARVGYTWNGFLPYVTGGVAQGDVRRSMTTSNMANTFTGSDRSQLDGYQAGIGVEKKVGAMSVGLEYLYTSLKDDDYVVRASGGPAGNAFTSVNASGTDLMRSEDSFDIHALRATAAYRF